MERRGLLALLERRCLAAKHFNLTESEKNSYEGRNSFSHSAARSYCAQRGMRIISLDSRDKAEHFMRQVSPMLMLEKLLMLICRWLLTGLPTSGQAAG